ncbi:MAG: helix-turn-helix transcriptional regulator [Lachnospiraceae bacterium]|nr:helix-turn-helix transcriptional regulator [Lachnospiraceae bacterium]
MNFNYELMDISACCFFTTNLNAPLHMHKLAEIVYVTYGSVSAIINEHSFILNEGSYVITSPNTLHSLIAITPQTETMISLFQPNFVTDFDKKLRHMNNSFVCNSANNLNNYGTLALNGLIMFGRENTAREDVDISALKGLLHVFLSSIQLDTSESKISGSYELCHKALLYIDENIKSDLSLKTLSAELHVSPYYLSHEFSRKIGIPITKYINDKRLNIAASLLLKSSVKITEAAYEAGFSSVRTFNRRFLESYKTTPMEYKQEHLTKKYQ